MYIMQYIPVLRNARKISSSFNNCSFSFLNHDDTEEDENEQLFNDILRDLHVIIEEWWTVFYSKSQKNQDINGWKFQCSSKCTSRRLRIYKWIWLWYQAQWLISGKLKYQTTLIENIGVLISDEYPQQLDNTQLDDHDIELISQKAIETIKHVFGFYWEYTKIFR